MRFIGKNRIEIDRELSDLDKFTLDFVKILEKHTKYVIVSGYVSILLGRARTSEDVDIIIPRMDANKFFLLFKELKKQDFYCLNAERKKSVFEYIDEHFAVRFAKKGKVIPNIELKFAKTRFDEISLEKTMAVKLDGVELVISHLELQIAFKEQVLKSPKDVEDANHIRTIAKGHLDISLIKKYEAMLHDFH